MIDIVERLREWATHYNRSGVSDHFKEAADEIELLRRSVVIVQRHNAALLAALQDAADEVFRDGGNGHIRLDSSWLEKARAAIKKANTE